MPKLCLIIKGISRVQAKVGGVQLDRRLISPDQLILLKTQWMKGSSYDGIMLSAAACLRYFGWFRAGEITAPASGSFDPMAHMTRHNITVYNAKPPQWFTVRLKQSKTDQFREGNLVTVGWTGWKLCPVEAVLSFLVIRGRLEGPLF